MSLGPADAAARISDDESPAYSELHNRVDSTLHDMPPAMRDLLFCVAYTLYSKRKKDIGARLSADGQSGKEISDTLRAILANDHTYQEVLVEAEQRITALTDATSNKVLKNIGGEIVDGIDAKINHTGASFFVRFLYFIKHSAIHALHIILAALIIYAIAQTILIIGPKVGVFLDSVGLKYLGDLLQSLSAGANK
ncbi:MAG: hypothetical protein H6907_10020 [Hyphomicrobiales bacterium]|nr:hypothetical protein [Hyphomicrobiales bacterium]MCP5372055.1 hypothetical protein [Hyphomicrobiales bacterium]